jgi:ribonucleoside-diphosphate reductase alpha chain
MKPIFVIKRDGSREQLEIKKVQTQIARACDGVTNVSESMIELKASIQFEDGVTTDTIDGLLLNAMVNLINVNDDAETNHTNYQYVAGKQRLRMLRKDVYGQHTPPHIYEIVKRNVQEGVYTPELLEWYSEDDWNKMESFLDHEKDERYSYAAIEQLISKYLIRNRVTGTMYETPQVRYMIASAVAFHMEPKSKRLGYVRDYYEAASTGAFTLATPVLAGLGTKTKQFSSCVLLSSDDTLDSIFATGEMMAKYAAKRAGIGLEMGKMRGVDAAIRGGEIKHTGITPFLKKWFGDLRSCSQGGIRNASATVNLPIWHYQFDDYIVLKNNQGTEENRVRHLDYCVQLNAFFFRRFKEKGQITLFDPNEVPELYRSFFSDTEEFERLYVEYEGRTDIRKKTLSANAVFKEMLLKERTDTGRIYLMFVDNVLRHTPFDVTTHPVVQTNLCVEILLPTKPFQRLDDAAGRIALCTLGSMNWGKFKLPGEMRAACNILVRALSNILGYQDFLSIQSQLSNEEFEPLGIGVTNLAYWHAKRGLRYGEEGALAETKRWMEHQAYFLTEATVDLAAEKGACKLSHTTSYGKGIFPWEKRAPGVNELTDFTPVLDWEPLRERMIKFGVRNATLMAIAPVESSSVVIDSTNGIELPMELISIKESKGGSLVQVVPEYKRLKNKYQLLWDQTDCIDYIKTSAILSAFCDQSISTNTFYSPRHFADRKVPVTLIAKNLMLAHKWGIKTFYYSLMEKLGVKVTDLIDLPADVEIVTAASEEDDDDCEACKL